MTEETATYMTAPDAANGHKLLPRRNGPRGLLPSTWLNRTLRIEYTDAWGTGRETSGTLLDFGPTGPILNIRGGRTIIAWDKIGLVELAGD